MKAENQEEEQKTTSLLKEKPNKGQQLNDLLDEYRKEAEAIAKAENKAKTEAGQIKNDSEQESDVEGLEFIDPIALKKAQLVEAATTKEQDQKVKLVKINGKLLPASSMTMNASSSAVVAQ